MGSQTARDIAEAVKLNAIQRRAALQWHLAFNHYPPLPVSLAPACEAAIDAVNGGDWNRELDLPTGCLFRGQPTARAMDLVELAHLDAFVEIEDDPAL